MIVLITGGREYRNKRELTHVLDRLHAKHRFKYLMHGDARGADRMAHEWAKTNGVQPVAMEALWDFYPDKKAGTIRNAAMLDFVTPNLVIAFSGGRGTANMMKISYDAEVEVIDVEDFVRDERLNRASL